MNEDVKREIILEHYQNPLHRYIPNSEDFIKVNTANQSCIDNLDIYLQIKDGIIQDIAFDGEACAISISSTSIMIQNLIGKTIEQAIAYITNFENMINEKDYDSTLLKDAIVYDNIYKQNSRKSCAYLPYRGILEALNQYNKNNYSNLKE